MTSENSLLINMKHTDDVTVDYWVWWKLSAAEKEYFTTNIDQIGSRPTIISLNSWRDLPIPSIQINDIRPQQRAIGHWDGTSRMSRNTSFQITDWLKLTLREELICPKRAYFLRTAAANDYFTMSTTEARTYISFFRWRKIIFMTGSIDKQEQINDGDLRQVYAWFKSQAPPSNLRHLETNMSTSRKAAHKNWLNKFGWESLITDMIPDEAQVHLQLPAKIKGFQFIHRGYAQLYAVTDNITAKIHPDSHGSDRVNDHYEWTNEYCVIVNIADLAHDDAKKAIRVSGRRFNSEVTAPHPHIHANGGCCWGGYREVLNRLLELRDVVGIFHTIQNFCQVIDPDSLLERFPDIIETYGYCNRCDTDIEHEDDSYICEKCNEEVCSECSTYHECCEERYCQGCSEDLDSASCNYCDTTACGEHNGLCESCDLVFCEQCLNSCEICMDSICPRCSITCLRCSQSVCVDHTKKILSRGRAGITKDQYLCEECEEEITFIHCTHCKKVVFEGDELHQCVFCGLIICAECASAHLVNDRFFLIQSDEERHTLTQQSICDTCFKDFLHHMNIHLKKIGSKFIKDYPIEQYPKDRDYAWLHPTIKCSCGRIMPQDKAKECTECQSVMCEECENLCEDCIMYVCNDCMRLCYDCEDFTCKNCASPKVVDNGRKVVSLCVSCTEEYERNEESIQ